MKRINYACYNIPQGPIYTFDMTGEGFATGGKDGFVKLWDLDFKSIATISIANSSVGYSGMF